MLYGTVTITTVSGVN